MKRIFLAGLLVLPAVLSESAPNLAVSTNLLTVDATEGAEFIMPPTFQAWNSEGPNPIPFAVSAAAAWMSPSPTSGTCAGESTPEPISVILSAAEGLSAGGYTGIVTVASSAATNPPQQVSVVLNLSPTGVVVRRNPTSISASMTVGTTNVITRDFEVWNGGSESGRMDYTISVGDTNWLAVSPTSGVSYGEVVTHTLILTNLAVLPMGTQSAGIFVGTTNSVAKNIEISLAVLPVPPIFTINSNELNATADRGVNPPNQAFAIQNSGGRPLSYRMTSDVPWISMAPQDGALAAYGNQNIAATFTTTNLRSGRHEAAIMAYAPTNIAVPYLLPVHLTVLPGGKSLACTPAMTQNVAVGSGISTQQLAVWNDGTGAMSYVLSEVAEWMTVSPTSGVSSGAVQLHDVVFDTAGRSEGPLLKEIVIVATGAAPGTAVVSVAFGIGAWLGTTPAVVSNAAYTESDASNATIGVWNRGSFNPVNYTLSLASGNTSATPWLVLGTTSSVTQADATNLIYLIFHSSNLAAGAYYDTICVSAFQFQASIPVELRMSDRAGLFHERIVFSTYRSGADDDICMISPDGTDFAVLLGGALDQAKPEVSPDGTRMLYFNQAAGIATVMRELMSSAETEFEYLSDYRWLPDGSGWLGAASPGFSSFATNYIYRQLLSGERTILVRELDDSTPIGIDPEARRIYYSTMLSAGTSDQIKRFDLVTGARTTVLGEESRARYYGRLSPDGRTLAFSWVNPTSRIWLCNLADRSLRQISSGPTTGDTEFDFSPTGDRLVFARSVRPTNRLVVVDLATGAETVIFEQTNRPIEHPCWAMLYLPPQPCISVNPAVLTNVFQEGTGDVPAQALGIWNSGTGALEFALSSPDEWLTLSAAAGTSTGEAFAVDVDVDPTDFTEGSYTGHIEITGDATNSPLTVDVLVQVGPPVPILALDQTNMNCKVMLSSNASRRIQVWNAGAQTLSYTTTVDQAWLSVLPTHGTCETETDTLRVKFAPGVLPTGLYSGTLTFHSPLATQAVPVHMTVVTGVPGPYDLKVDPLFITNTTPQYRDAPSQSFVVSNAGGNELVYYLSEDVAWLSVLPMYTETETATNRGERDDFTIHYATSEMLEGVYTGRVRVAGEASTQTVSVIMNVEEPIQHALALTNSPGGWVTKSPDSATYPETTLVRVTAHPSNYCRFVRWSEDASGSTTSATVRMTGPKKAHAWFTNLTLIRGYVTNILSGEPVAGARVSRSLKACVTTDASGYFLLGAIPGWNRLTVSRAGYDTRIIGYSIPAGTVADRNPGLVPNMVSNVRALQRTRTQLVDIWYDLAGADGDLREVQLQISQDGGTTWTVPVGTPAGDCGAGVAPGTRRHMVWNAGLNWDGQYSAAMQASLIVAGRRYASRSFTVDTRGARDWQIRAWSDRNGNDVFDVGEQCGGAEVYYSDRRRGNYRALTGGSGYTTIAQEAIWGMDLFVRDVAHDEPTLRGGHGAVDNRMFRVWLDNDIGGADNQNWIGWWYPYTLTHDDLAVIQRGEPLYVRLNHTLYEWNLTVATEPAGTNWVAQFKRGLSSASLYIYDVTDGQMKFGTIALTSNVRQGSTAWTNADVVVYNEGGYRANAIRYGIHMTGTNIDIRLGSSSQRGDPPDDHGYWPAIAHEFGHYGLDFRDEYISGGGGDDQTAFQAIRAANGYQDYPANYGMMDNQYTDPTEMSSYNDYLASYPAGTPASNVTNEIWYREVDEGGPLYPEYQWLERRFQTNYGAVPVEIVVPRYGVYQSGRSTSLDRWGPTNIPAPYASAVIKTHLETNIFSALQGEEAGGAVLRGPEILVLADDRPLPGARVVLRLAREPGRFKVLGTTGPDGRLLADEMVAGDGIVVFRNGVRQETMLSAGDVAQQPVVIKWNTGAGGPLEAPQPLTPGAMGLIALPSFTPEGDIALTFHTGMELSTDPGVTAHGYDWMTNALVMTGSGTLYTGLLSLADAPEGSLEVSCDPTNGVAWNTWDGYERSQLSDGSPWLYARNGRARFMIAAITGDVTSAGFVYQGNGPAWIPAGVSPTNQVGPLVSAVLVDPSLVGSDRPASLNLLYADEDVAGIDRSSLHLFEWVPAQTNWTEVPAGHLPELNMISASFTNLGAFILLGGASADTNPPAPIADLLAVPGDDVGTVDLTWTATGNDGTNGTAFVYVLKVWEQEITSTNWQEAPDMPLDRTPQPAGSIETATLKLSGPDTLYYLALFARDEAGNLSPWTNRVSVRTAVDDADGDGISDSWLESVNLGLETPMAAGDDVDLDGLTTWDEFAAGTDPNAFDSDGDGIGDGWELENGLSPMYADDADLDPDGDTLTNSEEYEAGTDPKSADTDGDLMTDDWELDKGLDPLTKAGNQGGDTDADSDTFVNFDEYIADTEPTNSDSHLQVVGVSWSNGCGMAFSSSVNRIYELFASTNLVEGASWLELTPPGSFYGYGDTRTLEITNPPAQPQFYRVRVRKP